MLNRKPITARGRELLYAKLEKMRAELPALIEAISEAKKNGDLSENFEYHAAKRKRNEVENEINQLDAFLKVSIVSKLPENPSIACFGCQITLESSDNRILTYAILGEHEANVENGSISTSSPLFRSMLGKKVGDEFDFNSIKYRITKISSISEHELSSIYRLFE